MIGKGMPIHDLHIHVFLPRSDIADAKKADKIALISSQLSLTFISLLYSLKHHFFHIFVQFLYRTSNNIKNDNNNSTVPSRITCQGW